METLTTAPLCYTYLNVLSCSLPPVTADGVGSYLVEKVILLSSGELFTELYEKLFKGRLLKFAQHPCANFVLQKLIDNCKDKAIVGFYLYQSWLSKYKWNWFKKVNNQLF